MFSKVAVLFTASMALLATASPVPGDINQCNTGSVQCCNSVQDAKTVDLVGILGGLLAATVGPITGQVGVTCSPLSVIGVGGNSCSAQPVCCTGNNFNGLVVVGCSPININL